MVKFFDFTYVSFFFSFSANKKKLITCRQVSLLMFLYSYIFMFNNKASSLVSKKLRSIKN